MDGVNSEAPVVEEVTPTGASDAYVESMTSKYDKLDGSVWAVGIAGALMGWATQQDIVPMAMNTLVSWVQSGGLSEVRSRL